MTNNIEHIPSKALHKYRMNDTVFFRVNRDSKDWYEGSVAGTTRDFEGELIVETINKERIGISIEDLVRPRKNS